MTTPPDRSVEEIAQSIIDNKLSNPPGSIEWTNEWLKVKIVNAIQAERQKREEVVDSIFVELLEVCDKQKWNLDIEDVLTLANKYNFTHSNNNK